MEKSTRNPIACPYVYCRGELKGKQCDLIPRNGLYCFKHSRSAQAVVIGAKVDNPIDVPNRPDKIAHDEKIDNHISELDKDPAFGGGSTKKTRTKKTRQDIKSTVITLTLNSNQTLAAMSDDYKAKFKKLNEMIYNDPLQFITDKNGDVKQVIQDIKTEYHYEPSAAGLIHSHGIIQIKHNGFLSWHPNMIRKVARELLGKNVYLESGIMTDPVEAWKKYISKNTSKLSF